MLISLHKQGATMPRIRAAIQASTEPAWKVAGFSSRSGLDRCLRQQGTGNLRELKPAAPTPAHK